MAKVAPNQHFDGQKAHDSFLRIGEPRLLHRNMARAGSHVSVGFANPAIIMAACGHCNATGPEPHRTNCHNTVTGMITTTA